MASKAAARDERIEIRATKEEKRVLARAAAHERLDLTSFIMRSALPAARSVLDEADRIILSERDAKMILDLLENPPPAPPALVAAAKWWRDRE